MRFIPRHPPGTNGHPGNGRGRHEVWQGGWGILADARSRISRVARRIEGELKQKYEVVTAWDERTVKMAAAYQALAEQTMASLGRAREATPRTLWRYQRAAAGLVAQLRRREVAPPTIYEILAREKRGDGHGGWGGGVRPGAGADTRPNSRQTAPDLRRAADGSARDAEPRSDGGPR
jgi:hypothetical protein